MNLPSQFFRSFRFHLLVLLIVILLLPTARARDFVILQSTTSTHNSGLLEFLIPQFESAIGIEVRTVAVGTGQALQNGRNGDGDVLLVHAKSAENQFVTEGYGIERFDLMYNDFVIVGPAVDPARIRQQRTAIDAFERIAKVQHEFISRGDDSGTHKKESEIWREAGIDTTPSNGLWYLETGSGMGATLNVAVGKGAYTLTDRGTWLNFKNRRAFDILLEGDPKLFNQYGVILVNPAKHPMVNALGGQTFVDWILGPAGQGAIASYRINGEQVFYPNASRAAP